MDDRVTTARKGVRVVTDTMMEGAVQDCLQMAKLLRNEHRVIDVLNQSLQEATDPMALCSDNQTTWKMAHNLLFAMGCSAHQAQQNRSNTIDLPSAEDMEVDDEATITDQSDFNNAGEENDNSIGHPQLSGSSSERALEGDSASTHELEPNRDNNTDYHQQPFQITAERNSRHLPGSGEQGHRTSTPTGAISSSVPQLAESLTTATQRPRSGEEMATDASFDRMPVTVRPNTAKNDWYYHGIPQPPVRRAAFKAMRRIAAGHCSSPEDVRVATAVGRDGKPWVDDRTNTAGSTRNVRRGGGGSGGHRRSDVEGMPRDMSPVRTPSNARGRAGVEGRAVGACNQQSAAMGATQQVDNLPGGALVSASAVSYPALRQSNGEIVRIDPRLFVYVGAKQCTRNGCVFWTEAHCHRGPACDCFRNRSAYTIPKDTERIIQHQNWHVERNNKPAIGERVLVKFEDEVWYKGTINARVALIVEGIYEWSVLFDDCTRDTFFTGDADVVISNQPLPRDIDPKLESFYRRQTNGDVLLIKDVRARHAAIIAIENDFNPDAGNCSSPADRATTNGPSVSSTTWDTQSAKAVVADEDQMRAGAWPNMKKRLGWGLLYVAEKTDSCGIDG